MHSQTELAGAWPRRESSPCNSGSATNQLGQQGRQPAGQGLGSVWDQHLRKNSFHLTKPILVKIFSDVVYSGCGSTDLLRNDVEAETVDRSVAGAFCSCRCRSTGHTRAALPCYPLLLLLLAGKSCAQRPSDHQCRKGEPCLSARGKDEG